MYGIAKRHRGLVTVESESEVGTTVSVYFPLRPQSSDVCSKESSPLPSRAALGQGETILIVEDNELVRSLMTRELTRAGYRVRTASDGVEAVALFNESAAEIDMVLTDLSMPKMGGAELLRTLKQQEPSLKAMVATGYNDSSEPGDLEFMEGIPILHKPYSRAELLAQVRSVLES